VFSVILKHLTMLTKMCFMYGVTYKKKPTREVINYYSFLWHLICIFLYAS